MSTHQQLSLFAPEAAPTYCQVVVEVGAHALDRPLTYAIPPHLEGRLRVGSHVRVPVGKQRVPGHVVGFTDEPPPVAAKPVLDKIVEEEPLGDEEISLAQWLAQRYRAPLAEALRCFLPPGVSRRAQRIIHLTPQGRDPQALVRLAAAPQQEAVLRALQHTDGLSLSRLARTLGGGKTGASRAGAAVRALVAKGLVCEEYRSRPETRARTRQVVRLADGQEDWPAVLARLTQRAPRQAQVISALLGATGRPLPVSGFQRQAVQALQRAGLVVVEEGCVRRAPRYVALGQESTSFLSLNPAQRRAVESIRSAMAAGQPAAFLIHGVTGSGKTEVYLHSIEAALQLGRSAIVLVPEIALTPQAVERFRARFGERLGLLHSGLAAGQRLDEWERIRRGQADIVVGARSAVFAPCRNLGIVVVDEEHEGAYKQDSDPRYAAQVVAAERARRAGAVLVLGSATPMVETYYAATAGAGLRLLELPERIDSRPLPPVEVVDLRQEALFRESDCLSERMLAALRECLAAGEQAILFLNRRGFSTFVMCRECGHSLRCPDCAVALTYHHATRQLRCHHCDHQRKTPERCENCDGYDVGFHGLGTERVADQVVRTVPQARPVRMDRDTTQRQGAHGDILRRFARGEANVLVGTQMIAKGHDFPNVTLVGVLNADTGLNRPDFRAAEHTFQILTQVSGRAGRADKPGRVIVQTYNPEHYAVVAASRHDYLSFYEHELRARQANGYPPFTSLIKIGFADEREERALAVARRTAVVLQELGVWHKRGELHFLGPAEAPLHKLRGQFRYHMLLKGPSAAQVREVADAALERLGDTGSTLVTVDIDPVDMM